MKGGATGFMPDSIIPYKVYNTCQSHPGFDITTPEKCAFHIDQQQATVQNANNIKYAGGGVQPHPYEGTPGIVPQIDTGATNIGPNGPLRQAIVGNNTNSQGLEDSKWDYTVLPSSETGTAYVFSKHPTSGGNRKRRRTKRRRTKRRRTKRRKSKRHLRRKTKKPKQLKKSHRRLTRRKRVKRTHRKKK